jgi:hypothetical protein
VPLVEIEKYFRWLRWGLIFLIVLIIALYPAIFIFNVNIPFINPSEENPPLGRHINLPSNEPADITMYVNGTRTEPIWVHLDIYLKYKDGVLVAGTPVDVYILGIITSEGQKQLRPVGIGKDGKISNIEFTFVGATKYNRTDPNHSYPESWEDVFLVPMPDNQTDKYWPFNTLDKVPDVVSKTTLLWDTEGDYSPIIYAYDKNDTPFTKEYPFQKIHVSGSDIIRQENYSKVNQALTIAVLLFTILEGIKLLSEYYPKKKKLSRLVLESNDIVDKQPEDPSPADKQQPSETKQVPPIGSPKDSKKAKKK